jgi:hypothetical protein
MKITGDCSPSSFFLIIKTALYFGMFAQLHSPLGIAIKQSFFIGAYESLAEQSHTQNLFTCLIRNYQQKADSSFFIPLHDNPYEEKKKVGKRWKLSVYRAR